MFSQWERGRWVMVGIAIILLIATIFLTGEERERVTWVEGLVREGLAPAQHALSFVVFRIQDGWHFLEGLGGLQAENSALRQEVQRLRSELITFEEVRRENRRLHALLEFKEETEYELLLARVIARDPSNWQSSISLNKGSVHGVQKGMAVVTAGGLVGHVRQTTLRTSEVLLIVDDRSAIGGLHQPSQTLVIVEGQGTHSVLLSVRPLDPTISISVGDRILSAGTGGIYPRNLLVGEIVQVEESVYGGAKSALLRPGVDLTRMEEVFILQEVVNPELLDSQFPASMEAGNTRVLDLIQRRGE